MTPRRVRLVRARCVLAQAWWLSLTVAAHGWGLDGEAAVMGLAMAWRDCDGVLGMS